MSQLERSYSELRVQIVEAWMDYTLEGPLYRAVRQGRGDEQRTARPPGERAAVSHQLRGRARNVMV